MRKLTPKKIWKQFMVINLHKWEVLKACTLAGHPFVGLKHDLSKYGPTEFFELARFQTDGKSPIWAARKEQGYSRAWQHHKGHNPHHWEYWTAAYRVDSVRAIKMPFKYVREMFCDYVAAGRAYDKKGGPKWTPEGAYEYWATTRDEMSVIDPETVSLMNEWYRIMIEKGPKYALKNLDTYRAAYDGGAFKINE